MVMVLFNLVGPESLHIQINGATQATFGLLDMQSHSQILWWRHREYSVVLA
jgi:hypothetical protein